MTGASNGNRAKIVPVTERIFVRVFFLGIIASFYAQEIQIDVQILGVLGDDFL